MHNDRGVTVNSCDVTLTFQPGLHGSSTTAPGPSCTHVPNARWTSSRYERTSNGHERPAHGWTTKHDGWSQRSYDDGATGTPDGNQRFLNNLDLYSADLNLCISFMIVRFQDFEVDLFYMGFNSSINFFISCFSIFKAKFIRSQLLGFWASGFWAVNIKHFFLQVATRGQWMPVVQWRCRGFPWLQECLAPFLITWDQMLLHLQDR